MPGIGASSDPAGAARCGSPNLGTSAKALDPLLAST